MPVPFGAAIRFGSNESGQDLAEYALIAGLVSLAAITAMVTFADQIRIAVETVANLFANAL